MPHRAKKYTAPGRVAGGFLALLMRNEGIGVEALARQCDVTPGFFTDQQHRGFPFERLRWKIEAACGYRAIWSPGSEIEMRRRCQEMLGVDPRLISLKELQGLCRRLGTPAPSIRQREHFFDSLGGWLAAHTHVGTHDQQKG